jgi:hypothetical protein
MKKTTIKAKGTGLGQNERIEVLTKDDILSLINQLDEIEILKKAWEGFNKGYKHGYAILNLKTGQLETESLSTNERNQAIDNQRIIIYDFDMNFDISDLNLVINKEETETEEDALFDYILYSQKQIIDINNIKEQLDYYYSDEEPI